MRKTKNSYPLSIVCLMVLGLIPLQLKAQAPALRTPLPQEILTMLTNEISGQMIFNNMVTLAGAPWLRDHSELTDTFFESQKLFNMVRNYGIKTSMLSRSDSDRTFEYPLEAEFWIVEPEKRLVARLGADAALLARSSQTADVKGQRFSFTRDSNINQFLEQNPDSPGRNFARSRAASTVLNYINGRRSITTITHCVAAETGSDIKVEQVAAYIDILEAIGWVNL